MEELSLMSSALTRRRLGPTLAQDRHVAWSCEMSSALAARWPAFVDWQRRIRTEGPFLKHILREYRHPLILDAAAGIGFESVWLAQLGHRVIANEISPSLREQIAARARCAQVELELAATNWLELEDYFGQKHIDVTLMLGNSLCLLQGAHHRAAVIRALRAICARDGTLVIDERNFEYILSSARSILAGTFRYAGRVMYCGTSVRAVPIHISHSSVRFSYVDNTTGAQLGALDMHPFRRGELYRLLTNAGFTNISVFSDLQPGVRTTADFYTYVCR